ncbi:MAG TPA: lactoylglutathione lyase [Acholeplasmataceae bacterium]|nr:lactoylglutathione lyase [Acholeplasmataceae bacterium]HBO67933.1 lactoylglutathione lyase [Acholeplasmataceae bacterium]HBS01637.1 lactoylglutathione lyase [Acholeplasmataceae bacterium]HCB20955.1 lactoylglutathione lyase [Acholeplasmataceae bacterium]
MLNQIQPFIPAKDFQLSKQFYQDLGFKLIYEDSQIILFEKDKVRLFIQRFYDTFFAENLVFQLYVDDIEQIHQLLSSLLTKYPMIKISKMKQAHYGMTFTLIEPSGVLFHITDPSRK